jgi:hypothetical protein
LVRKKKLGNKTVYQCEICGLGYLDWETARKCEEWCKKTGTCSIEITKKAVYFPKLFNKHDAASS